MKISNVTLENRIRDLPTCSAVPQPIASPRAPPFFGSTFTFRKYKLSLVELDCCLCADSLLLAVHFNCPEIFRNNFKFGTTADCVLYLHLY